MAAETKRPRVLVLRCRACRTALPAASHDVAFRCPRCGRAWEIEEGDFRERPSLHVPAPSGTTQQLLHLPYWSFTVSASVKTSGIADGRELIARDRAAKYRRAYVSAFSIYRPTYVGEWGLVYTRIQPQWEARSGHGPEAPGATLGSRDALKIATHYILAEIDRAADIGSLDLDLQLTAPELWAIPCYDLGEKIRCPWTRAELPAASIDDLSEIRRATERLEA